MVDQQNRSAAWPSSRRRTKGVKPGDTVMLLVRRGDADQFIALTVPSAK